MNIENDFLKFELQFKKEITEFLLYTIEMFICNNCLHEISYT